MCKLKDAGKSCILNPDAQFEAKYMCVAKHMAGQIPYSLVPKIDVPGLLQYILLEFIWTVPLIVKQLQVSLTLVIAFLFQQSIIFYEFILKDNFKYRGFGAATF